MVAPCCRLCYDHYLNLDRTLDEDKFQEFYKYRYKTNENVSIVNIKKSYQPDKKGWFKFLKKMPDPVFFYQYSMVIDDKEIEICNCQCHIKGDTSFH